MVLVAMLAAAGCNRGESASAWTAAQRAEYETSCAWVANDLFNTKIQVEFEGALEIAPVCRCAEPAAAQLFPSYGHWRTAVDAAAKTSKPPVGSDYGVHANICNTGIGAEVALVNWCAEISACARARRPKK